MSPTKLPEDAHHLEIHAVKWTSALSSPHSSLSLVEQDILIYAWGDASVVKACLACTRLWIPLPASPKPNVGV